MADTPRSRLRLLPLLVPLALAAGFRTGIAAPFSRPLPPLPGGPAVASPAAGGLAHAAFAVG
ncbi:MAG TPA: hypothetical protein VGV61_16915 [Thermoanaerobaculia bacterium]|jgi:hypothetical protein|nr:hypothetical protein [Thermoanaerobaculia bacterium]